MLAKIRPHSLALQTMFRLPKFLLPFLLIAILLVSFSACNIRKPPKVNFEDCEMPAPPDYTSLDFWAAHPDKVDEADGVPDPSLTNGQAEAQADVFFIHPTTFIVEDAWNADVTDEKLNKKTDESTIRHQASIFNGSCRVYAPRYRQMVYGGFYATPEQRRTGWQAYETAYQDVKTAFEYYLENENEGRPFVLATHSQGTAHAIRLTREFLDGKPLAEQLVTAYLVGWPIPTDTFSVLKPCETPGETGCYTTWCTFAWDYYPEEAVAAYQRAYCSNPVSWTADTLTTDKSMHKGTVLRGYKKVYSQALEVKATTILSATKPDVPLKFLYNIKNYHVGDYNLFWMDVRENVALRVQKYLELHGK